MTIYKVNNQEKSSEKDILEKKLLAESLAESTEPEQTVTLTVRQRRSKTWLNIFLILVALLVLAAGITGGVLLYKRLSHHKVIRGICGVGIEEDRLPHASYQTDEHIEPYPTSLSHQKNPTKTHFKRPNKQRKMIKIEEEVEIIDEKIEKIHIPSFGDFSKTMILHDFEKNYSAIVDYDRWSCYVMKLDRSQVAPPKNWIDLIQKFASGYYMPRAEVLKRKYRVILPAVDDTFYFGHYISAECLYFKTYRLLRIPENRFIEKRDAKVPEHSYVYLEGIQKAMIEIDLFK